jgi:hypothetical protein
MKEQENISLWRDSPHQNSGQHKRTPRENLFTGNGISPFADPESPLSLGLQTAPWPLNQFMGPQPSPIPIQQFQQAQSSFSVVAKISEQRITLPF